MRRLVDEFRGDKRHTHNDEPLYEIHPVSLLVGDATRRLVDMRLEEAHHRGYEVPRQVDGCQEAHRFHGDAVGEQHLDIVDDARLLFCTFTLSLGKLGTLLQLALQVPGDEGHDEQREEHDTRREHIDHMFRLTRTYEQLCHLLYPSEEVAARSEQHAQQQDNHRTDAPRHLRDTNVTSAIVHLGRLGDIGPRGRHTHADGDARNEESAQQHGEIHAQHDEQHTRHIDQQVVGEDKLSTVLVGQETTDDSTYGSTQTVGRDKVQPAQMYLREPKVVLPQRQA